MRQWIGVWICILLSILSGCTKSEGADDLKEGNRLLASRNPQEWKDAITFFERSIQTEMQARNQMVVTYKKLGRHYMREGDKALIASGADLEGVAHREAGAVLTDIEFFPDAIRYFEKAVELIPNDKLVHYYLGICYAQMSRSRSSAAERSRYLEKAITSYETMLELDPDSTLGMYGLGMVFLATQQYERSLELLNRVVRHEPGNTRAYFAIARVYFEMEEYRKAESVYRMLQEMVPAHSLQRTRIRENLRLLETR